MEKNSSDKSSCSEFEENNDNGEISSTSPFNNDNFCISCCSCDNNVGTDCESRILNPVIAEDIPAPGRARSQKLDVLKCLSLARTNREQEAIHNILQFIEALTYSNSFVRRYNMPGYFCHQCSIGEICNCYVEDQCHLSQIGCSCGRCSDDSSSSGSSTCSLCDNSDGYSYAEHRGRTRTQSLRNRRRRERRRNSRLNSRNAAENPRDDSESACATPRQSNFIPRVPRRNSSIECSYPLLTNRCSPICNIPNRRNFYRRFHGAQTSFKCYIPNCNLRISQEPSTTSSDECIYEFNGRSVNYTPCHCLGPSDPRRRVRAAQESTTTSSDECICELYGKSAEKDILCHCWRPQDSRPRIRITVESATTSSDTEGQINNVVHGYVNDCDTDSSIECSYPLLANHSSSIDNIPTRDDSYRILHGAQTSFACCIPNCNRRIGQEPSTTSSDECICKFVGRSVKGTPCRFRGPLDPRRRIRAGQEYATTSSDECTCELYGKSGENILRHCWRCQDPRPEITITEESATTSSDIEGNRNNVVHGSVNGCDTESSIECSYPLLTNQSSPIGNIPNHRYYNSMFPGVQHSVTCCVPDCNARIVEGSTTSSPDDLCICGYGGYYGEDIPCHCWGPPDTRRRGRGDGKSSSKSSSEDASTQDYNFASSEGYSFSNCHCAQCQYATQMNVPENSEESSADSTKDHKGEDSIDLPKVNDYS